MRRSKCDSRRNAPQSAAIDLPPMAVYCPVPSAVHPAWTALESHSLEWLAHYDYFGASAGKMVGTKSAEFAARVAPNGRSDRMQIASDWDYWGFAFDDRSDHGVFATDAAAFVSYAHDLLRMLESREPDLSRADSLTLGLADISARLAAVVTPDQHRRWVQAHRAWLFGVAAQICADSIDLNRYLSIRLNNAAGEVVTVTGELVCDYDMPADEYQSPAVRAVTEMARMIAALDNDLHSYLETMISNEVNQQNIISVIAEQQGCGTRAAIEQAIRLRDRIMCRFLALRATTRSVATDTRRYLHDLGYVIRGNIDWAVTVPRYAVAGRTMSEMFSYAQTPADSSPHPPGLPAIDWWWRV